MLHNTRTRNTRVLHTRTGMTRVTLYSFFIFTMHILLFTSAQTGAQVMVNTNTAPLTFNYISGGETNAQERFANGEGCAGWLAEQPDHILTVEEDLSFFRVTVNSASDTTMVMIPVDAQGNAAGTPRCDDDTIDTNPELSAETWQRGTYYIFVGSFEPNSFYNYSITFSQEAR